MLMPSLLSVLLGLLPPALCGWLLVRCLEHHTPVLTQLERGTLGVIFGITFTMFVMFLLNVTLGVPLTLWGFLMTYAVTFLPLLFVYWRYVRGAANISPSLPAHPPLPLWGKICIGLLAAWTMLKIGAMTYALFATPTFFDDTIDNWNLRAKVFLETQRIELVLPPFSEPTGVSSYPPAVPLFKTWIMTIAGRWDESASNGVHAVWYVCCLVLLYCGIRRRTSIVWALLGVYLLSSLPLFLLQGMNAYADVYLASHILAAVSLLFFAANARQSSMAVSTLRISAVAIALLTVAKNEGLALYTPFLLLTGGLCLWKLRKAFLLTMRDVWQSVAWCASALLLIAGPWVLYKQLNGLVFGNAHSLSDFSLSWHGDVPAAILINTFLEGNWLLLFPLLLVLLSVRWRTAFSSTLAVPFVFFLLAYGVQILLYLFTSLASEALMQTGYARGVIHLVPVAVLLTVLLVHEWMTSRQA